MKILITGGCGFIGYNLAVYLSKMGFEVIALDNVNDYYDVNLKISRINQLKHLKIKFYKVDVTNFKKTENCVAFEKPDILIHLAAQAGVRFSLEKPNSYINNNVVGFFNILEICKVFNVDKLIFASSSSVYGNSKKNHFDENDNVDNPINLYAASKKSNELMAYSYSHLYDLPCVGVRFFTVYGPWGRPDMAYFKFTKNILEDSPINVYGNGDLYRDFTYIDDIVEGIAKLIEINNKELFLNNTKYEIFNLGNNKPIKVNYFISVIEKALGKNAKKNFMEIQPGDVIRTSAKIDKIKTLINFSPKTNIEDGLPKFVNWFKNYYKYS